MEFLKKESTSETTESFSQRVPLGEKHSQNLPFVSQIQELMATLTQKKSQLKQAKLRQSNLLGKQEQQDVRINKIKIGMDHEIEKEQAIRSQQDRLQQQINICKESIKELTKTVKTVKSQLGEVLQDIIAGKKNKLELENICAELQFLVQAKTAQNIKIDEQIQNLQTLILCSQNDVRSRQDEYTNLQLQKTELCSLLDFLEQKLKQAVRAKNSAIAQHNDLAHQQTKMGQKIQNIKRQTSEVQWSCEQIRSQNSQIDQLNQRLVGDLEGVKKHLAMMEKMNQLLQNSLAEYGITGDKVSRLIHSAKIY